MYKSLKYLLLTCCVIGTAYGSASSNSDALNFDTSGLTTHKLSTGWFGSSKDCVFVDDLNSFASRKNAEIQEKLAQINGQHQRALEEAARAANSELDSLRQQLAAASTEKQEMSLAFEQQLNSRLTEQQEKAAKEKEELLKIPAMLKEQADRERVVLVNSLENSQMLIELLKEQQKALLTAKTGAEADALSQKQRSGLLEHALKEKEGIIKNLEEKQRELQDAALEKQELQKDLEKNQEQIQRLAAKRKRTGKRN
ncbi:hypothetical protein [Candidatus Finniella inopinata]|uniref:Uncharacterized protein n=1 Tax=Candidatus Finniella inopinata TaxID=1696036 RepID=A0A4Q7DJ03_9PROT|nr:hypothetical protein [Candidatus Finniella inopinata]RZI46813.1 hypothetical protein EQU50_00885 [Candidatus Finniella inopinata]